jgi:hypothetical protein
MITTTKVMESIQSRFGVFPFVVSLRERMRKLFHTTDLLEFFASLNDSIVILVRIDECVRSQQNQFGRHLPQVMLVSIFDFLSLPTQFLVSRVCKTWNEASRVHQSRLRYPSATRGRLSFFEPPIKVCYPQAGDLIGADDSGHLLFLENNTLIKMDPWGQEVYRAKGPGPFFDIIGGSRGLCRVYPKNRTERWIQVEGWPSKSNSNPSSFVKPWQISLDTNVAMSDNVLCTLASNLFSVYSLDGLLVRSFPLHEAPDSHPDSELLVSDRYILVRDKLEKIVVFSIENGEKLYAWTPFRNRKPLEVKRWVISKKIVFILSSEGLSAFTIDGHLVHHDARPAFFDAMELTIGQTFLHVCCVDYTVYRFRLK